MLKSFYLFAAVIGTVVPYAFFASFISTNGLDIPLFLSSLFVNGASGGFAADLVITSVAFWAWSYFDAKKHNIQWWWIIPANLLVGLSLALPLYLFFRQDRVTSQS
jgi:hypothetical protein